jgi:ribosomal-protein-serine acetyltransferase
VFRITVNDHIELELISKKHADDLFHLIDEHRSYLAKWLIWPNFTKTVDDYLGFVERSRIEFAKEESLVCVILYEGKAVGTAGYIDLNKNLEKGEIGYWLASDFQGKGIITQVTQALIDFGFEELGLSKVELATATENHKSQAVCERLGLTLEGVISHAERLNGILVAHNKYAVFK